jgi:hypothetical protein
MGLAGQMGWTAETLEALLESKGIVTDASKISKKSQNETQVSIGVLNNLTKVYRNAGLGDKGFATDAQDVYLSEEHNDYLNRASGGSAGKVAAWTSAYGNLKRSNPNASESELVAYADKAMALNAPFQKMFSYYKGQINNDKTRGLIEEQYNQGSLKPVLGDDGKSTRLTDHAFKRFLKTVGLSEKEFSDVSSNYGIDLKNKDQKNRFMGFLLSQDTDGNNSDKDIKFSNLVESAKISKELQEKELNKLEEVKQILAEIRDGKVDAETGKSYEDKIISLISGKSVSGGKTASFTDFLDLNFNVPTTQKSLYEKSVEQLVSATTKFFDTQGIPKKDAYKYLSQASETGLSSVTDEAKKKELAPIVAAVLANGGNIDTIVSDWKTTKASSIVQKAVAFGILPKNVIKADGSGGNSESDETSSDGGEGGKFTRILNAGIGANDIYSGIGNLSSLSKMTSVSNLYTNAGISTLSGGQFDGFDNLKKTMMENKEKFASIKDKKENTYKLLIDVKGIAEDENTLATITKAIQALVSKKMGEKMAVIVKESLNK